MIKITDYINEEPDFPIPGVSFKDISPLLRSPEAFKYTINALLKACPAFDVIVAPDARGFIFGTPLALAAEKPFVMVRKKGKLPGKTISQSYDLEYGSAALEIQKDSLKKGARVVIVDDILATGGTINAIKALVEKVGARVVKMVFVIELAHLNGRENIHASEDEITSLVKY